MTDEYEPAEPNIKNCTVSYNNSEPKRITVVTEHFVDDLFNTEFTFKMVGSTAELDTIATYSDKYYVQQNEPAREKAIQTVKDLPFVQGVKLL